MTPTPAMNEATNAEEMADAFHPASFGRFAHRNDKFDIAEAALLWAAGRISKRDFFSVLEGEEP